MSFLDVFRSRSRRIESQTSTTAGDIFRGTVEVPEESEEETGPRPGTNAYKTLQKAKKAEAKKHKIRVATFLKKVRKRISVAADRGEYSIEAFKELEVSDSEALQEAFALLKLEGYRIEKCSFRDNWLMRWDDD